MFGFHDDSDSLIFKGQIIPATLGQAACTPAQAVN